MRQNAAVWTNAQALWRQPQTNRTVRIERRENKTPKNKKRPLPQSPLPLSGKGRGEAQKHASAGEEFGQRQERGQRRMGKGDSAAAFKGVSEQKEKGRPWLFDPLPTEDENRAKYPVPPMPNAPLYRRKKHLETSRVSLKNVPVFRHNLGTIFQNFPCFFLGFLPP